MLGELARWLRLLGYDTHYSKELNDDELISRSERENRVLLTSDQELYKKTVKHGTNSLLLKPDSLINRLTTIAKTFKLELKLDPKNSRCPICNGEIRENADVNELQTKVPSKVLKTNKEFWICTNCGKVYWIGGHWKNITRTINDVKLILHQKSS
jgi:uncharacterized protein with PIN domain